MGVRFTFLPLLVLRVFDHSLNKSFRFYHRLFAFLTDSPNVAQIHQKLLIAHYHCARAVVQNRNAQSVEVAYGMVYGAREIVKTYEEKEELALSTVYSVCGCPMLCKFHRILEVLALLRGSKCFFEFLFLKCVFVLRLNDSSARWLFRGLRAFRVPIDERTVRSSWDGTESKNSEELEHEFWAAVTRIQNIIEWTSFRQNVESFIDELMRKDFRGAWRLFKIEVAREYHRLRAY